MKDKLDLAKKAEMKREEFVAKREEALEKARKDLENFSLSFI